MLGAFALLFFQNKLEHLAHKIRVQAHHLFKKKEICTKLIEVVRLHLF